MTTIPPPSPTTSYLTTSTTPSAHPYPLLLLFGDSITQSSHTSLIPPLSTLYLRRADILNRGFSGYTTLSALPLLPLIFPSTPPPSPTTPRVILQTIWFGANDASEPPSPQHVPLEKYVAALREMVRWEGGRVHGTVVLVLTPPPVDEWQLGAETTRKAVTTKRYADAAKSVALEERARGGVRIAVVDVWSVFMRRAGWVGEGGGGQEEGYLPGDARRERNEVLARLLSDGLHLTAEGYGVVFEEMMRVVAAQCPEVLPERVPVVFPDWKVVLGVED